MRLDNFFEKFDLFADSPDAVAKMRELVLQLAFRGGLSGKSTTNASLSAGWEQRTIESICSSLTPGFACSRSHQVEDGHVHLRTHNISTLGTLNFDLLVRIDPKMVDPMKSSLRSGDILFNNTNSQELVGKSALVDRAYDYGFSNHITRLRLKEDVDPGFVVYYLTLLRNSGYFAKLCTRWINQAAVNTETLKAQSIPLPPLAEQKRIVAKVDDLMALCDRLEAQQQERETRHAALARASLARFADAPKPANLDLLFHESYSVPPADLRKSILTLAIRGMLVPQDPDDEDTSKLLGKIRIAKAAAQREQRSRSSETDSSVIPASGPYELPNGWVWTALGDVQVFTNGYAFKSEDYQESGIGIVRMGELGLNGEIDESDMKHVSEEIAQSLPDMFRVRPGDLLMGMSGSIGKLAINRSTKTYLLNQRVGRLEPVLIEKQYLYIFLRTVEQHYLEISFGMAIKNLSTKQINETAFPLPPLAEQRRIVAKVDELMALVDALETHLAQARATGATLVDAVVAELTAEA